MKEKVIFFVVLFFLMIPTASAMCNYPPEVILTSRVNEFTNATLFFANVPTSTLEGYEKWTTDGKTLNRSLSASDLGLEFIYPENVSIQDNKTLIDISIKASKSGRYVGALFYRTSGQFGIAAGTWIKLIVVDNQTSVPTPTPKIRGGGRRGGSGYSTRDSDGDGYSDIEELIAGTDPNNPNDYPCKPYLSAKPQTPIPSPTPKSITTPPPVINAEPLMIPTTTPTIITANKGIPSYIWIILIIGIGLVIIFIFLKFFEISIE